MRRVFQSRGYEKIENRAKIIRLDQQGAEEKMHLFYFHKQACYCLQL